MFKKFALSAVLALINVTAAAHDEAHSPKMKFHGKYGGKLSAVILKKDADNQQAKAEYAAELTTSSDGVLRLYFYDKKMHPVTLSVTQVKGEASYKSKATKKSTTTKIEFKQSGDGFESKLPGDMDGTAKIEIDIGTKEAELIAAFTRVK